MQLPAVEITGAPLTVAQVVAVAQRKATVKLGAGVAAQMEPARRLIDGFLDSGAVVYGVTTGFGALATTKVNREEAALLQVNLLRSHAAGVGEPLPDDIVRAMLLLRARTLSQGYSGVRPVVVERLCQLLEHDLLPVVPSIGSVGASGDLAPFAHLALPLIGEGYLRRQGQTAPAGEMLSEAGLEPIVLEPKEGLSLLNGTEGMLAMTCLGIARARRLARAADVACGLSIEALMGSARPFRPEIHELRPHPGQSESAARIAFLIAGSEIGASHADDFSHAVQDAYSLRCAPQVHGAVLDTITHAETVASRELGSVVDNPIVLPATGEVLSGGNFHGAPLAFVLDFLAIGTTELGSISERRVDRMLDPQHSSGLPPFLARRAGLESGYMLAQYTAAALVAESRVLAHPASIDSIPTSGSQEDHVSMGWGAGRKLGQILDRIERVVAIELLVAAQGVEYRQPLAPSPKSRSLLELLRTLVPSLDGDRPLGPEIETMTEFVAQGGIDEQFGWKDL